MGGTQADLVQMPVGNLPYHPVCEVALHHPWALMVIHVYGLVISIP